MNSRDVCLESVQQCGVLWCPVTLLSELPLTGNMLTLGQSAQACMCSDTVNTSPSQVDDFFPSAATH